MTKIGKVIKRGKIKEGMLYRQTAGIENVIVTNVSCPVLSTTDPCRTFLNKVPEGMNLLENDHKDMRMKSN